MVLVVVLVAGSWIGNFVKLMDCDFESPYKCEVIHGVGIVPAVSLITVWFDADEDTKPKP